MNKMVYVCSPYRANNSDTFQKHLAYARKLTKEVLLRGDIPITPHLYMTQCLNDQVPEEREIGLDAGIQVLDRCEEMLVGIKYGISPGMDAEIKRRQSSGQMIEYVC